MPRFYFDFHDADTVQPDTEGLEFESFASACHQAKRTLPAIALDRQANEREQSISVVVKSDRGTPLYTATLTLSDADLMNWIEPVMSSSAPRTEPAAGQSRRTFNPV